MSINSLHLVSIPFIFQFFHMKNQFVIPSIFLVLLALLVGCQKQESSPPTAPTTLADLRPYIGKNYDLHTTNLYGVSAEVLASLTSDELFGTADDVFMPIPDGEALNLNTTLPSSIASATDRSNGMAPYAWFSAATGHNMVYNWDVFLKIEDDANLPATNDQSRLVFWAVQTNFGDVNGVQQGGQGAHAGLQWWGAKKANWGGYWNGSVAYAKTINFNWVKGREYRLRIWRTGAGGGIQNWGCWIMDMVTQQETFMGEFPTSTVNKWIAGQVLWTETYGPVCNKNLKGAFNRLQYRCANAAGVFPAAHATVAYGGSTVCAANQNTNVTRTGSLGGYGVRQQFNTTRTNSHNTLLW